MAIAGRRIVRLTFRYLATIRHTPAARHNPCQRTIFREPNPSGRVGATLTRADALLQDRGLLKIRAGSD
jgi:hypothetical protein